MNLTTPQALPMIVRSSARRRHGPARDVLRTNVPVAGQPSRRVGWGATARAGGGLPDAVADPVGPRVGSLARAVELATHQVGPRIKPASHIGISSRVGGRMAHSLTGLSLCATINFDPRSGTVSGPRMVWPGINDHMSRRVTPRVEEKTSREPNGRTREEGSDRGHPPPRGRTSYDVALVCLASEHWARAACVV